MLTAIDWVIVAGYLILSIGVGFFFKKAGSKNINSYFVSGRRLPWWILGTSMVATTFAADTPLAVTGWVRTEGIWKNWFWWNYAISHVLIIVVFSRLWRRAEVITDNELIEMRYSGKPAAFLRGFKAFYFSTIFNFIVMGWVISAMTKVLKVFFGFETTIGILICLAIAFLYTMISGLWGVAVNDFIQYILAIIGTTILAYIVINSDIIGGFGGFVEKVNTLPREKISFFLSPEDGSPVSEGFFSSSFYTFLIYITVIWWSSHNSDGGGYFIQRLSSAKNEKHAVLGMAWFTINHYIIRLWPWVLVAIASIFVFTNSDIVAGDDESVYVLMIKHFLGPGLVGLLLVTFLAAFMSTISTQLNWGASYLVNDIYRRFIKKTARDSHYILVSRVLTFLLAFLAGVVALYITNIGKAWIFLWSMSSGIGLVLILRWFWWRINAWSEIVALASSLIAIVIIIIYTKSIGVPLELKHQVLVIPVSIVSWVIATFITSPEPLENLKDFYNKVKPWGFWGPVTKHFEITHSKPLYPLLFNWVVGVVCIMSGMIGVGKLLLGYIGIGILLILISLVCGVIFYRLSIEEY